MKTNKIMRIASVLLVAVLLSTCVISGTFAKYVTTADGTDTARVAKWGFAATDITIDMFDGNYTNVQSGDSTNVVAPGTTKTATIAFMPADQAAPEVAYDFDISIDAGASDAALLAKLVWSLDGTEVGDFAALQTAVAALSQDAVAAGSLPDNFGADETHTITWEWDFYVDDVTDGTDTALGNAGTATLEITITTVATQID